MKITLQGSPRTGTVRTGVLTLVSEAQVAVGLVLVAVSAAPPPAEYARTVVIANRSGAGQNIRVGVAPSFGPVAGVMLAPGDSLMLEDITFAVNAIADGAGGVLDALVLSKNWTS